MTFDKVAKMGKGYCLEQMVLGKLDIHMQQNEGEPQVTSYMRSYKYIKDLKLRLEAKSFLEKNIGEKLYDTGFGEPFQDITTKAQATKSIIHQWDYINLKNFCEAKKRINKGNRWNGRNYLQTIYLIRI